MGKRGHDKKVRRSKAKKERLSIQKLERRLDTLQNNCRYGMDHGLTVGFMFKEIERLTNLLFELRVLR